MISLVYPKTGHESRRVWTDVDGQNSHTTSSMFNVEYLMSSMTWLSARQLFFLLILSAILIILPVSSFIVENSTATINTTGIIMLVTSLPSLVQPIWQLAMTSWLRFTRHPLNRHRKSRAVNFPDRAARLLLCREQMVTTSGHLMLIHPHSNRMSIS